MSKKKTEEKEDKLKEEFLAWFRGELSDTLSATQEEFKRAYESGNKEDVIAWLDSYKAHYGK